MYQVSNYYRGNYNYEFKNNKSNITNRQKVKKYIKTKLNKYKNIRIKKEKQVYTSVFLGVGHQLCILDLLRLGVPKFGGSNSK